MSLNERAERLGISVSGMKMLAHLTDEEIKTQKCECGDVIKVHDGGLWRFRPHPVRCDNCVAELTARGETGFDARFVG